MKYFIDCKCIEDVKTLYRKLAFANHPDVGGDTEIMKAINAEYDEVFNQLKNKRRSMEGEIYETQAPTNEAPEEFRHIIEELIKMEGVKVELIGRWIWVTGDTKPYLKVFKSLGFTWAPKKAAWTWHYPEDKSRSRGKYDMSKIRTMFGSTEYKRSDEQRELT